MAEVYDTADGDLLDSISNVSGRAIEPSRCPKVFEGTSTGIILTDARGKIVQTNGAAERMLDGRVLLCVEDELSARDSRSAADLQAAIAQAGRVQTASRPREATSLIAKGPGSKSIAVWVMPLNDELCPPLASALPARVAVFAQEVGNHSPSATGALSQQNENSRGRKLPSNVAGCFSLSARPIPAAAKR